MGARCTPRHMVSYQGEYYAAGEDFEIAAEDAEEMSLYGQVDIVDDSEPEEPPTENNSEPEEAPAFGEENEPEPRKRRRRT